MTASGAPTCLLFAGVSHLARVAYRPALFFRSSGLAARGWPRTKAAKGKRRGGGAGPHRGW